MEGEEIHLNQTMKKIQLRTPTQYGGPPGPIPASIITHEISKWAPIEAISVVSQENDACAFLLHGKYRDVILRASGRSGLLFTDKEPEPEYELCCDQRAHYEVGVALPENIKVNGMSPH